MSDNRQKQIELYAQKLSISLIEAEQLLIDDEEDTILPEVAEMTEKAKSVKRYEQSDNKRQTKPKERKVDTDKAYLLSILSDNLTPIVQNVTTKTETEVSFTYNGENYTLKLTKHRATKK